ncbi:hypothetical protein ABW20_dc0108281 [Dactylellina cionopaga]|nr:hypothetical protein ABW20_dc0108281 [Dactylellina cionopaga]
MAPNNLPDLRLNLDDYPDVLYRIHFPGRSATLYDPEEGFSCLATGRINVLNYNDLYNSLEAHLDWYSDTPTHLISMFRTKNRAIRWARKQLRRSPRQAAFIMTIDPQQITNKAGYHLPLLEMSDVADRYPDVLPDGIEERWVEDEFLALYKIPAEAIINVQRVNN